MHWLLQFLTNPLRSLLGLLGMIAGGIVLFVAIAHSAHAEAALGGTLVILLVLVAVRVLPLRVLFGLAVLAFVVIGVVSLISELIASGVVTLLLILCGLAVLGYGIRWARAGRGRRGYSPVRRRRRSSFRRPYWLRRWFR